MKQLKMKAMMMAAAFGFGGIALLAGISPQPAAAWFASGDREPSKYARHVACNEAWRASHAYKVQKCQLRSVHWDSYHNKPGFFGSFMAGSTCWVHVECDFGKRPEANIFPKGIHQGKIKMNDVHKLRQCKHDASLVNTSCDPLTKEHVDQAVADHEERMNNFWAWVFKNWDGSGWNGP